MPQSSSQQGQLTDKCPWWHKYVSSAQLQRATTCEGVLALSKIYWSFCVNTFQSRKASPLPADNTTLAAPPLHKLIKTCLLLFFSSFTVDHSPYTLDHKSCTAFLHPFVIPPQSSARRGPSPGLSISLTRQMAIAFLAEP